MKKHWKVVSGFVACIAILACAIGFFVNNNTLVKETKHTASTTNFASSVSEDDFVILEIVPDKSYAQLGYLQAGQEPIDILEASKDGKASDIKKVAGDSVELKKTISKSEYNRLKDIYGNKMEEYWTKPASGSAIKYTFVDGKEFPVNKNQLKSTLGSQVGSGEEVVVKTLTSSELEAAAESDDLDDLLDKTDLVYISQSYVDSEQKSLAKEYAKEGKDSINVDATFDDSDTSFPAVKKIFTRVGDKKEPLPIVMDKTIYTKALNNGQTVSTKQYALNRDVKYNDDTKDSWAVSSSSEKKKNLFFITDYEAGSNKPASNNNMYKLYLMTMFRDPAEFYNLFVESGLVNSGTYKLQSDDTAQKYWNTYTFLPCKKEIRYNDHEKGTESFWKDEMAITLSPKDGKWRNCNAISLDSIKADTFIDLKDKIKEIFDYKPKSCMEDRSYHVLELEPANHFSLSAADIERMLPYTSYTKKNTLKVKITEMTTAEYIGKIDDLVSDYDLVYIGNDIDGFHKKDGKTYFGKKNESMKGVIYAHYGSKVLFQYDEDVDSSNSNGGNSNGVAFFDSGDSGSLRFSGNDITELKKKELVTFLNTGLPVVVADGLVTDAKKDDPEYFNDRYNNNMRLFLKDNADKLLSLDFNYRNVSSSQVEEQLSRLTRQKPTLTINSLSAGGKSVSGSDLSKNQVYTFDKSSPNRKFTFSFKVDYDVASEADFIMKLYVDKNADGKFASSERVGMKNFRANGNNVSYTFAMNPQYTGAFTWKLEVYPRNNTGMLCSQVGYSTIRFSNNDVSKRTVHVLQVQAVAGDNKHNTSWGREKAQQVRLDNDEFLSLLDEPEVSKDYDIKITVIDMEAFTYGQTGLRSSGGGWYDKHYKENLKRKDMKEKYDMLIFGFADSYRDMEFDDVKFAQDIQDYIDAGKSVLFSHDLTSQINNSSAIKDEANTTVYMENTNGRGFNKYLRDAMGLDRYNQGKRVPGEDDQCSAYTKTGADERYGFTYTALMQYSNFRRAWAGGTDDVVKTKEYFGPYKHLYLNLKCELENGFPYIDNGYATTRVTSVNDGQITKYPFDLSKCTSDKHSDGSYEIATTHGQCYQLNMESDDVVCWFALSDSKNGSGWYSASPNDVANNYYIYNKGNVTYTGVGHSKFKDMTEFEQKLFVNTIIASLRAGVEGPQPQITNGYNVPEGDEDRYVVYADVDADSPDKDFARTEDVEFYALDDSTKKDTVFISLEVEKADGTYENKTEDFKLVDSSGNEITPITVTNINDSGESIKVWKIKKSDLAAADGQHMYTIKYPRSVLKDQSSQNFILNAYSNEGSNQYKIKGYQYGAVMRRALFPLD